VKRNRTFAVSIILYSYCL